MELQLTVQIPASYFGNQIAFQVYGIILLWMLIWTHHTMMNFYFTKKKNLIIFFDLLHLHLKMKIIMVL